jgi:Ca2+-binding RTX toxin-like protein
VLEGGAGGDCLVGGAGADTLRGGDGWDHVTYQGSQSGVVVDLAAGGSGGDAEGDVYSGIEVVEGSDYGDQLTGSSQNNSLIGHGGDDRLDGGAGADWLHGNEGNDTLAGGQGADFLIGGQGFDIADYRNALEGVTASLATGGSGGEAAGDFYADVEGVSGSSHADQLTGDAGANRLAGNGGNDTLIGGAGDDILVGGDGADALVGGEGWDTASYADATSAVTVSLANGGSEGDPAGDSFVSIEGLVGSDHADQLFGDAASNVLVGLSGGDVMDGGDGNDALYGGFGHDTLIGAVGNDELNGDEGNDFLDGGLGDDTAYGGVGGDVLTTGYGNDVLDGGEGNDTLVAGGGDDLLLDGAGADVLDGGAGFDTLSYADAAAGVVVSLAQGGDPAQGDTFTSIEGLSGSSHGDHLAGDSGNNVLAGNGGHDTLLGGAGADTLVGGAGRDTASYTDAASGVAASLLDGGTDGIAAGDVFEGIENLAGSDHADWLSGDASHNGLAGLAGNDLLDGGAGADSLDSGTGDDSVVVGHGGNDTLLGGAGSDTLDGGDGIDIADYSTAAAGLTISLAGGGSGDVLVSIEGLIGSLYDDVLTGDGGANLLSGGAGNDILRGGGGSDTLWGERGSDVFAFDTLLSGSGNVDRVMDFDFREDRLQLDGGVFAGLRSGSLDASAFTLDKNATSLEHRIVYHAETGELFFDADGTGRSEQVKFAQLMPGAALSADLFLVV